MLEGGISAPARMAATLLLLNVAAVAEGGFGLTTDQHGCRQLCESVLGQNDTETLDYSHGLWKILTTGEFIEDIDHWRGRTYDYLSKFSQACLAYQLKHLCADIDKVSACEEGCITVSHCLHHHHNFEEKGSSMAFDMSKSCLMMCESSCTKLYGAKMNLGSVCIAGCEAQHRQMSALGTIADAQFWSQRMEILEDAVPGIGIKEDKTHNVSLNLGGNIQTNVTSNAFVGPKLEKGGVSTRGGKKVEDRTIKFDLQGDIDNDTVAEETLSKHGEKGVVSYGKRGKEYSENTSINIQGVLSRNGSYMDVSSQYKPLIKRIFKSPPRKRRGRNEKKRSKKRLHRRPRHNKVQNRKPEKPKAKKLGNVIPQEVEKVVKTPVASK